MIDIDLNAPGKSAGYLHLHNSTNESAWQAIRLPVWCLNGTPGPTTLLLGGMHGDEYEGPVAISNLYHACDSAQIKVRIIAIPAMNLPAVMAGKRLSPVDGANLNRVFPGDPRGSLTSRMAWMLTNELIPLADNVIDLHSGGRSLRFHPCTLLHQVDDPRVMHRALTAAIAFGAPMTVILREDHADMMLDTVVEAAGKVMISSELGGSGVLTSETAALATKGLRRCLAALGHFEEEVAPSRSEVVTVAQTGAHVLAEESAIFEPLVALGQDVLQGQQIARAHFADRSDKRPQSVFAVSDGKVLCLAGQGMTHRGDVLCVIATSVAS